MQRLYASADISHGLHGAPRTTSRAACSPTVCFTNAQAQAREPVPQGTVTVRFSTHFKGRIGLLGAATMGSLSAGSDIFLQAQWGEKLKVVGSCPVLGGWDVAAAPDLHWSDGHVWTQAVEVPAGAKIEYKVVHLHHSGVDWEPTPNRVLVAGLAQEPAQPGACGLDVNCQWSHPDATSVSLLTSDPCELEQLKSIWDLTASGLPQDLTEDLAEVNTAALLGASDAHSEELKAASVYAAEAAAAVAAPASDINQAASAAAAGSVAATGPAEAGLLEAQDTEDAETTELPVNGTTKSPLQKVGQAASYAAMAVGAGVLLSAMAIDVTDAALASAVVAAGAAVLPGSGKGREKKALRSEKAPMIEALSMGLDAVQNVSGAIRRAQTEGVGGNRAGSSGREEAVEEKPDEEPEEKLAAASSMDTAEAAAAAEAQTQAELALKSSIAQDESRPVVQPEQARRWDETLKSEDEDDTPDIGLRAHSVDDYTPGLSGLEQARRWGETYNGQREADTPDIGPRAHSMNGSTPGIQ